MQPIEAYYRGRAIKIAGERVFQNWNVTMLNDNDFKLRNVMEQWSQLTIEHGATNGEMAPVNYATDLTVKQLDRNGASLREYTFKNCWVQSVSDIQLDMSDINQIERFNVEFSVDYWVASGQGSEVV
jgi:hypothetical protein